MADVVYIMYDVFILYAFDIQYAQYIYINVYVL